jgi:hypothetical protein
MFSSVMSGIYWSLVAEGEELSSNILPAHPSTPANLRLRRSAVSAVLQVLARSYSLLSGEDICERWPELRAVHARGEGGRAGTASLGPTAALTTYRSIRERLSRARNVITLLDPVIS